MNLLALPFPTSDLVTQAVLRFNSDDRYGTADRVLSRIFSQCPTNTALEDVLLKVALLDRLYNTNVFVVLDMALHIRDLNIDASLAKASTELVDKIARLSINGNVRRHYSFATKYCSWHRPADYPIYDNLVEKILLLYQEKYKFAEFSKPDLREYSKFKEVLNAFRIYFHLESLSFKELDKFLWWTSNELGL